MQSVQKSMRMPQEMANAIQQMARATGQDFSTVTKELLEEAIKMRRCPGIVFSVGTEGRRARLAGSGLEVWEVIQTYKSVEQNTKRLALAYEWLSKPQLRAALVYYDLYPMEIDTLIEQNIAWNAELIRREYPSLNEPGA